MGEGRIEGALIISRFPIADAGLLVVATADITDVRPLIRTARALNPGIPVIVRAPNAEEAALLLQDGAQTARHAKEALADAMARDVLAAIT